MAKIIVVAGDVIIDHNIYQGQRSSPDSKAYHGTMVIDSPGGASLLYEIINEVSKAAKAEVNTIGECSVEFGINMDTIKDIPPHLHSYAVWSPCPTEKDPKETTWRIVQPLGYGNKEEGHPYDYQPSLSKQGGTGSDVIVLDDGALGFRFSTAKDAWPEAIRKGTADAIDWVVLKMSSPVAQGDLWRKLSKEFLEKLVVIISIGDIRNEEVMVTKGLSWERTAQDLLSELTFNARIRDLKKCRHLIINYRTEGALWMDNDKGRREYRLIFDPEYLEGEWGNNIKGNAFGYVSCLTAAIVNQLVKPGDKRDIGAGIISGLSAMRRLQRVGHGNTKDHKPAFPFNEITGVILGTSGASSGYSITKISAPSEDSTSPPTHWTIVEGFRVDSDSQPMPLYGLARRVALFGARAISNIPYARFCNLLTVDRSEIESLRGIQRLINDYETKASPLRPLSIAVFGPPGSGKSFAIKQIARAVLGDSVPILEFNLSQFTGPEGLFCAFHQVRDKALEGRTPFVFWDEFDSKGLMWLQYLLAPMQDGKFLEGQICHPIGKCVFVFAGGTSFDMESFVPSDEDTEKIRAFKLVKGPDFVSRLSGYLNVLGPNRRQTYDKKENRWMDAVKPVDICVPIRRALALRVALGLARDEEMKIDKGLLTAFLEIDKYKHGARSLETLALLSRRTGLPGIRRSDLPSAEHVSLHVNYDQFMGLVNRDLPFNMNCDVIAPAVHDYYRELCKKNGWPVKYDVEYQELPDEIKADNLAAAARIPEVLSLVGLLVVPENRPGTNIDPKFIEDNIELLAEAEHDGWTEQKLKSGWVYGLPRNEDKKIHNAMKPYKDLSEGDKDKDRNAVRSYPDIVKRAGYKIVHNK